MGERKVLNKYFPPDFDPSKLPHGMRRQHQQKNQKQIKVGMMLPMTVRCRTCGIYMYKGTKFNSKKEDVTGENYLGIQNFRFYFKCTNCSAELIMKTDPQNSDYVVEAGATRNFEPWRAVQDDEEEMTGDAMKSLEKRTMDSKREMDNLATLDELKSMKSRHAKVREDVVVLLEALQRNTEQEKEKKLLAEQEEEDEKLIQSIFPQESKKNSVRRINDNDDDDNDDNDVLNQLSSSNVGSKRMKISLEAGKHTNWLRKGSSTFDSFTTHETHLVRISVVKKKPLPPSTSTDESNHEEDQKNKQQEEDEPKAIDTTSTVLESLCEEYGNDESDQ
ncbi:splicing factor YJU2-like [Telopea speciosissima]|uniref:splicing factor YJU2-like n=1 Tax=Telopea speciosissima TaxID=54955 RepID=UPI001CC36361|nr:splicing factor YJU2-like [Telopea speciosissima]